MSRATLYPSTLAVRVWPVVTNSTCTSRELAITWLFVMMSPSDDTTIPVPAACPSSVVTHTLTTESSTLSETVDTSSRPPTAPADPAEFDGRSVGRVRPPEPGSKPRDGTTVAGVADDAVPARSWAYW